MSTISNIRKYVFEKLFHPNVVVINKPGFFISYTSRKYGKPGNFKRQIWYFEDILSNIELDSIKKLGRDKTAEMWYKIGKDTGNRYLLMGGAKRPPKVMLNTILEFIANSLNGAGLSFAEQIEFKDDKITFKGSNNLVCRKTTIGECFAGFSEALYEHLSGEEHVKASCHCNCPDSCNISVEFGTNISNSYKSDFKFLMPLENYRLKNSPKDTMSSNQIAFSKLMSFDKITFEKEGKFYYLDKTILPYEIGISGIINHHYKINGASKFFKNSVINNSKKMWIELNIKEKDKIKQLKLLLTMLCAFGWGIPDYIKKKNQIIILLKNNPFSKFEFNFERFQLIGFIKAIFGENITLIDYKQKLNPMQAIFTFELNKI